MVIGLIGLSNQAATEEGWGEGETRRFDKRAILRDFLFFSVANYFFSCSGMLFVSPAFTSAVNGVLEISA
jgi:hypothetical protein